MPEGISLKTCFLIDRNRPNSIKIDFGRFQSKFLEVPISLIFINVHTIDQVIFARRRLLFFSKFVTA
jgi:hypothetical protein